MDIIHTIVEKSFVHIAVLGRLLNYASQVGEIDIILLMEIKDFIDKTIEEKLDFGFKTTFYNCYTI